MSDRLALGGGIAIAALLTVCCNGGTPSGPDDSFARALRRGESRASRQSPSEGSTARLRQDDPAGASVANPPDIIEAGSPEAETGEGSINDLGSGQAPVGAAVHAVGLQRKNSPPIMDLRTRPPAVPGDPYPVISGPSPLTVRFNLCRSSDPDMEPEDGSEGDSLNWQFNFGDDRPVSEGPDTARVCRTEHTYAEGVYVATVSVTDKHLEDQDDFSSLARVHQKLTIQAGPSATSCVSLPGGTFAGMLTGSKTQLGRTFRDAVPSTCSGKPYPGLFNPANTYAYTTFGFRNEGDFPTCVQVNFDPNSGPAPCAAEAHATAYLGGYNPLDQAAGFLGDVGSSVTQPFSFVVPARNSFVIAVHSNNSPAPNCSFEFSIVNTGCP